MPFVVINATKSPKNVHHLMPSIDAECNILVGNTLYIFCYDFNDFY